jgi:hypothetical protein
MAMIKDNDELQRTFEQLHKIERALRSVREDLLPRSPQGFSLIAEGYVDTIDMLRDRIDEYTGLKAARELSSTSTRP